MVQPKSSATPAARHNNLSYYHLLWDHELSELAPIMEALVRHRQEILERS